MNILWLTSPFRTEDILTNYDVIWVYTENEKREGGGSLRNWMRSSDKCMPIIYRSSVGKDGYWTDDNITKKEKIIKDSFHSLHTQIKQGKLIILPILEIEEAKAELDYNTESLIKIFEKEFELLCRFKMTTLL